MAALDFFKEMYNPWTLFKQVEPGVFRPEHTEDYFVFNKEYGCMVSLCPIRHCPGGYYPGGYYYAPKFDSASAFFWCALREGIYQDFDYEKDLYVTFLKKEMLDTVTPLPGMVECIEEENMAYNWYNKEVRKLSRLDKCVARIVIWAQH
jgi:hypothetical protein